MVLLVAVIIAIVLLIAMALFAWAAARDRSGSTGEDLSVISDFHNWALFGSGHDQELPWRSQRPGCDLRVGRQKGGQRANGVIGVPLL